MDKILCDYGVLTGERYQAKLTKILVRNAMKIVQYFKFRNQPILIGNDLGDIWETPRTMPPLESAEQCFGIQMRTQTKVGINGKIDNRVTKYNMLQEELQRRGIRDFDEIYTVFTVPKIMRFNASIGLQWREIAKQAVCAINRQGLLEEQTRTYLENLKEKKHDCYATSPGNIE